MTMLLKVTVEGMFDHECSYINITPCECGTSALFACAGDHVRRIQVNGDMCKHAEAAMKATNAKFTRIEDL
jgi:hypothetical protein